MRVTNEIFIFMNFSQLKFALSVDKEGSFSKAADACHVTQPTLSNAILKLEDELGQKIFERSTRKVSLTELGKILLPKIDDLLLRQESILSISRDFEIKTKTGFRLGVSPLVDSSFLATFIQWVKKEEPRFEIILVEENLVRLEEMLIQDELDMIFVPKTSNIVQFESISIYQERLYYIDSENRTDDIELSLIRDKSFLMVPDVCGLSDITRNLIRTVTKSLRESKGKALSYQVLCEWANNGMGSAILPLSKINNHSNKQLITLSKKPVEINIQARWRKEKSDSLGSFVKIVSEFILEK